jgi:hypothetical protein
MAKKFTLEKEIEYKNGQVNTWYMVKLEDLETNESQFIDMCKDNESKAYELLDSAINKWVPCSKTIIKEVVVEA